MAITIILYSQYKVNAEILEKSTHAKMYVVANQHFIKLDNFLMTFLGTCKLKL